MTPERSYGVLGVTAGLLGLGLVAAFAAGDFGLPGTAAYRVYETLNRLIAIPLLLMACGWLGLALALPKGYARASAWLAFAAAVVMAAGTAAEFWLFSDQPYGVWTNGRMASFMSFFVASLLLYVAATVVGVALWRSGAGSRVAAVVLMAAIPLYAAAILTLGSNFLAPAILALAAGWAAIRSVETFRRNVSTTTTTAPS